MGSRDERQLALRRSGLIRGEAGLGIERLLRVARRALDAPTTFLSVLDDNQQTVVSSVGAPTAWDTPDSPSPENDTSPLPEAQSLCRRIVETESDVVVTDAEATDLGAFIGVPVKAPDGSVVGAFAAITDEPRQWDNDDVAILTDLAAAAELAIQLRETSDFLSQQLRAESLERSVEDAMGALAAATNKAWTINSVVNAIVAHGRAAVGAELLSVLRPEDDEFRFYHGDGVPGDIADRFDRLDRDAPYPIAHSARTGETVVLPDRESFAAWPDFADAMSNTNTHALVCLPILDAIGEVEAVLGIGFLEPLHSAELSPTMLRLRALVRQGLERAASYQQEQAHAAQLEAMVLPDALPTVESLQLSGMYFAPTVGQRVGGDLFDAVVLPNGSIALVVADATGHTLAASQAVTRLRHAVALLSHQGQSAGEVLTAANEYLIKLQTTSLITCVYVQIDPTTGSTVVANAGHPAPRIVRRDGSVDALASTPQPLLGFLETTYDEQTTQLEPGDSIVLFTDGLIERRGTPMDEGEAWLERELAVIAGSSADVIASHLTASIPAERADDVAVLTAHRTKRPEKLVATWASDSLVLRDARARLRNWLGSPHSIDDDILLVLSELLTNARDASTSPSAPITLDVSNDGTSVTMVVGSSGPSFHHEASMPDPSSQRGRGLALSRQLADLSITHRNGVNEVTAHFDRDVSNPHSSSLAPTKEQAT